MKEPRIIKAMDYLDDELITGAVKRGNKMTSMKKTLIRWGSLAAAIALVLACSVLLTRFISAGITSAVIALDVNPSLEIEVNKQEKVISVNALNEDAIKVIGDMELKGVGLDVALNALIGSMLQNGYLTSDQNSILISVDADDADRAMLLRESLSQKVSDLLGNSNISASVLTQNFDRESEITEAGASAAVSALADKILAAGLKNANGEPYKRDELVCMKINELKLILESKDIDVAGVESSGNAGAGKYIGKDSALSIALQKAGMVLSDILEFDIEIDFDAKKRSLLYEVEFEVGNKKYEFKIHALSGEIIDESIETDDDGDDKKPPAAGISEQQALELALRDAGLDKNNVSDIECELDGGVWSVEFETGDTEYDYKIDPASGEILKKDSESKQKDETTVPPSVSVNKDEALASALTDAGLTRDQVRKIEIELDDGIFKVEFETDGTEYEYEIDPSSGAILKKDAESKQKDETTVPPSVSVNKDEALAAALKDAGLTLLQIRDIEIEFDDGVLQIEFETKTHAYEYEIDLRTGKILNKKIEKED